MVIFKVLFNAAFIPAIAGIAILKWITVFFSNMTDWIFRILSLIIFLTAILSFLMQLSSGRETIGMLIGAFCFMPPTLFPALLTPLPI